MDDNLPTHATCGSCDWTANGYRVRCDDPAPYRAEFRIPDGTGPDYGIRLCARHARDARTCSGYDVLERIYSA